MALLAALGGLIFFAVILAALRNKKVSGTQKVKTLTLK